MAKQFTIKQIAASYGYSETTTYRRLKELKKSKLFKKKSKGKFLNEKEALLIAKLLDFKIDNLTE